MDRRFAVFDLLFRVGKLLVGLVARLLICRLCVGKLLRTGLFLLLQERQAGLVLLLSGAELLPRRAELQLTAQALHKHFGFADRQLCLPCKQLRLSCRCLRGADGVHGVARRLGLRVVALIGLELFRKERLACFKLRGALGKLCGALGEQLFTCRNACRIAVLACL